MEGGDASNDQLMLAEYLQNNFHVPTEEWWRDANLSFQTLKKLLSLNAAESKNVLDSQDKGYIPSARLARMGALPKLVCFATGNHALGLTARNETLECVVFGTISANLFIDVFWESIQKAQAESPCDSITVSSVLPGRHPVFTVRINDFPFDVNYGYCEHHNDSPQIITLAAIKHCDEWSSKQATSLLWLNDLAEKYSNYMAKNDPDTTILRSQDSIVASLSSNTEQESPHEAKINFDALVRQFFEHYCKIPEIDPFAYGYIDDEDEYLTEDQLSQWSQLYKFYNLQSVDNASFELIYTKFRLMNSIIETGPKERWQHFSYWKNILASIHQRPLTERIESEALVEINFMYSGTSSLECWRWLKMVKNRLNELRTSLLTLPSTSTSQPLILHFWPQILVDQEADDSSPLYEGCFLAGIKNVGFTDTDEMNNDKIKTLLKSKLESWVSSLQKYSATPLDQKGYLSYTLHSPLTAPSNLRPSTHTFRIPSLTPPNPNPNPNPNPSIPTPSISLSNPKSLPSTTHYSSASQKAPPLRTAKSILHRLRHDPNFDIENYIIGYRDRHAGIVTKGAGGWKLDAMDEEWVPEHKILWFAQLPLPLPRIPTSNTHKPHFIWHREHKLDLIFGSGGSISRRGKEGERFSSEI